MLGLLFSGQGAQKTGITQDLYESLPSFKQHIDQAAEVLKLDLPSILYDSAMADQLAQTRFAQPAILAMSWSLYQELKTYLTEQACFGLGLSLGEYSALTSSGYVDFATGLKLIKRRGELMQQASEQTASEMVAIMKADLASVEQAVQQASQLGAIGVANVNTPQQIVIGGVPTAVERAVDLLKQQQEKLRVVPLKVSGAFHTPLMQPIQAQLNAALTKVNWQIGTFPVFSTTTKQEFAPQTLSDNLTKQLVSTTYFAATLQQQASDLTAVLELGPGKTLLGFAKKIVRKIPTYQVDSYDGLQQTITALEAMD